MPIKIVKEGETEREVVVLSYSSFSVYRQCPKRYYLEKVVKIPLEREDITFTVPGSIVHHAAGKFFEEGTLDYFDHVKLREELEKYSQYSTVNLEGAYGSFDKAFSLVTKAGDNLRNFLITREPGKQYLSEKWFGVWNAPLYISDTLAIQGAADLIEINPNGTALLYDFKTSWNMKNVSRDQLILYTVASKLKWDINVTMASFFLLPTNKQNYFTFTEDDKTNLMAEMQLAADTILREKENLPAKANDKCKYCPFAGDCETQQTTKKVVTLNEGPVDFNFGAEL